VLRGEPLVPLSDVTFAEASGRGNGGGNGRRAAEKTIRLTPSRKRAAAMVSGAATDD
jgi:hypothetical protein